MATLLALSLLWPLCLTALTGLGYDIRWRHLWWTGALPAGLLALSSGAELDLPWLLVGMRFSADPLARAFLFLAAVVWTVAGWQLRRYPGGPGFRLCYGLTLLGNLGALTAYNGVAFYVCFSLMALAAYGLLRTHPGARQGARWYLAMALVGELALLCAVLLLGEAAEDFASLPRALANHVHRDLIIALVYLSFAIKVGNLPLHFWLPLAYGGGHPLAALLFGGIITNLGIFGWMRFLPLGELHSETWSHWFLFMGVATALGCALLGACQQRPRTILGYSSASQMGLATVLIGVAMGRPDHWVYLQWIMVVFSLHHGLIKAGLILQTTQGWRSYWQYSILAVGALALAGLPPTSGWLAKHLLKESIALTQPPWSLVLEVALPLSSVTTALMMIQFLRRSQAIPAATSTAWIGLLASSIGVWLLAASWLPEQTMATLTLKSLGQGLEPLLISALLVVGGFTMGWGWHLPAGDLWFLLFRLRPPTWRVPMAAATGSPEPPPLWRWLALAERRLRRTQIAGLLLLSLLAFLVHVMW